jgi:uncharacterized protein YjfI (DUF2170 family)
MNRKTSAHYQREYRRRLREQGLVKKEVWICPEHSQTLAAVEKQLRNSADVMLSEENRMSETTSHWTTESLYRALSSLPVVNNGEIELNLIDGVEPVLCLVMVQFGDLPLYLTVAGEQILVDAWLWPLSDVRNPAEFNDVVLRSHKLFPLSTISLETHEAGESYYSLFGALSSQSKLDSIVIEIETLARNVMQVTEAYTPYLVSYAQGEA